MSEYKITKADLNESNEYIGKTDLSNYNGSVTSDPNLGYIKVKSIRVTGGIYLSTGCGIEAGEGIEAGCGIEAGWGIKAGCGIVCKWISSRLRIFAGLCLCRLPTKEEQQIVCEELREGKICFGELVIKKPEHISHTIEINGKIVELSHESFVSLKQALGGAE